MVLVLTKGRGELMSFMDSPLRFSRCRSFQSSTIHEVEDQSGGSNFSHVKLQIEMAAQIPLALTWHLCVFLQELFISPK